MADDPRPLDQHIERLRNTVESVAQVAEDVQLLAFRGGVLATLVDLLAQPIELEPLSELVLMYALDGGRIADSGSVFVLVPTGEKKEVELLLKVALTQDKRVLPDHEVTEYRRFVAGDGIAGQVLETGEPYIASNCQADSNYKHFSSGQPELKSLMAVPIKYDEFVMGVLCVHTITANTDFPQRDVEFVQVLANIASIVARANYNDLTMLPSRTLMNNLLKAAIEEAQQGGRPLSLAYLDIDDFGQLNKDFGHDTADEAIRQVAAALADEAPQGAILCHRHGDEFALIFRDQNKEQAIPTADRIRNHVAQSKIQLKSESGEIATVPVTVSVGVAQWEPGMEIKELTDTADAANQKAKKGGKNRVEGHTQSVS